MFAISHMSLTNSSKESSERHCSQGNELFSLNVDFHISLGRLIPSLFEKVRIYILKLTMQKPLFLYSAIHTVSLNHPLKVSEVSIPSKYKHAARIVMII